MILLVQLCALTSLVQLTEMSVLPPQTTVTLKLLVTQFVPSALNRQFVGPILAATLHLVLVNPQFVLLTTVMLKRLAPMTQPQHQTHVQPTLAQKMINAPSLTFVIRQLTHQSVNSALHQVTVTMD
jgi:hypothetical protein